MAVRLRLRRMGRKKRPFYRIVATDQRAARDGRFIESIGFYDPLTTPHQIELQEDRVFYWLENGAQLTDTVKSLLSRKGILLRLDLKKRGLSEDEIEKEFQKWELLQVDRAKRQEAVKTQTKSKKEKEKKAKAGSTEEKAEEVSSAKESESTSEVESTNETQSEN